MGTTPFQSDINTEFWIKFGDSQPVSIDPSFGRGPDKRLRLENVSHLIGAILGPDKPLIEQTNYQLHLSQGLDQSNLGSHCFASTNDHLLSNDCRLTDLKGVGTFDNPLILKRRNEVLDETKWNITTLHSHANYQIDAPYFLLPVEFSLDKGDLLLYCRSSFRHQFEFLEKRVVEQGCLGWILGPPGTGKTMTALAFASTMNTFEWSVSWIQLRKQGLPLYVNFDGNTKKTRKMTIQNLEPVLQSQSKKHIVFIDGYRLDHHKDIVVQCQSWFEDNKVDRRVVIVSSMSSRGKTSEETDDILNVKEFLVHSWTLQEYQEAVKNDVFYSRVKVNLDANDFLDNVDRSELIESKFYFAGGSSRYMFDYDTGRVIHHLQVAFSACDNMQIYMNGSIGSRSNAIINRLFNIYEQTPTIISKYAASELAMKLGPELVRYLTQTINSDANPCLDGWLWEMWFFANLRTCGLTLYDKNDQITWPNSTVKSVDVENETFPNLPEKGIWMKPVKWNQGGYDCVYIEKSLGLIRFVQVTRGIQHDFKIQYFAHFLSVLAHSSKSFHITTLEIVYVVDYSNMGNFKIGQVTGQGLLEAFGWKKGQEKKRLRILGLKEAL